MTGSVQQRPTSPVIVREPLGVRMCDRRGCGYLAAVQYTHQCGRLTQFCEVHRREHEARTDPALYPPAICTRCGGASPWPVPWSAVTR